MDLFDLSGKAALVTGGSRGLGREMVSAFARAGADVVIASRKMDAWDMAAIKKTAKTFALRRGGEPPENIGAALYFASKASSFCSGAILRLDGGVP